MVTSQVHRQHYLPSRYFTAPFPAWVVLYVAIPPFHHPSPQFPAQSNPQSLHSRYRFMPLNLLMSRNHKWSRFMGERGHGSNLKSTGVTPEAVEIGRAIEIFQWNHCTFNHRRPKLKDEFMDVAHHN
ncbi:hypothetical protein K432DRAFT_56647 [Lepidopterella palustris CBS 459.81]|uniref:Uncharacterized protein n=1 Tax=Lepidopterella palustris CBS 459.81 TaxID=1314670 RepID=A0A8E2EK17_9PEZI|nr:hypothetical protein K432DRAFT_56647 [Lepidopterella palustris CBS 459.81]